MYDRVIWPERYDPKISAIYALNDIDVKAPPEVVWKLLVDAENWSRYFPAEDQVKILSGGRELALGTRYSRVTVGFPMSLVVMECVPDRRLAWATTVDGDETGSSAYHGWVITPTADGCHVLTEETQQGPWFLEELGRKHPGALFRYHQLWVESLARAAEAEVAKMAGYAPVLTLGLAAQIQSEMNYMNIELKGRKAIVTGSTAGIGRATAEGLARAGASVIINGRRSARVDEAVRQMRQAFPDGDISGVAADLSTAAGADTVFAQASDADILVNNVGTAHIRDYNGIEDIAKIPDEDWLGLFQLNVMSGVRMARHYLPRMVRKGWGRVVFVSSESAVNIPKEMLDYGMTKTAQLAVSRGLAEAVAGTGVTVNAVLPGPTRSEILGDFMTKQAEVNGVTQDEAEQGFLKAMRPTTLIQRFATTDEVANMIVYACSEQASATTGAALRVEGGVVRFVA